MNSQQHHEWISLRKEEQRTNSGAFIYVSTNQSDWSDTDTILVTCGEQSVQALIIQCDQAKDTISASPELFIKLHLDGYSFVSALFCKKSKKLTIGPIVGVITEVSDKNAVSPFPSIQTFCEEMTEFCIDNGALCYIYPWHEMKNGKNIGYRYQHPMWQKVYTPPPHFLYNRIHSRKISYSKSFFTFSQQLIQRNIPLYNKLYLSKQDMYDFLKSPHLRPFLPAGSILNKESFFKFLNQHNTVFVKPIFGSQGRGIYRVKTDTEIRIESSDELTKEETFSTVDDAWLFLSSIIQKRNYLIQEGLSLLSINQHIADFRVLTHLQMSDEWTVSSVTARLSKENSFIANLSQGGTKISPTKLLKSIFGNQMGMSIYEMMMELAIAISTEIQQQLNDSFIELGIDIGVETNGKLKLIEMNAKPSKKEEGKAQAIRPSTKAIGQLAIQKSKILMEEGCLCQPLESSPYI